MNKARISSKDIIRAAMRMEEHGRNFYLTMADSTADAETKQMFTKLAEEEKEHYKFFKRMLEEDNSDFIFDVGQGDFIVALTSRIAFPNAAEHSFEVKDTKQALAIGIQAEKDSILLYHELLEEIQNPELKKVIHGLLRAEKMHLVELREHLEELGS